MARWGHDGERHWWRSKMRWQWFWGICFEIFVIFLYPNWRPCPQLNAISPDGFKDCLVQQQFIFDPQLRFAADEPVHLAQLNSKCFRLVNMCFLQFSLRSRCNPKYLASWGRKSLKPIQGYWWTHFSADVTCADFATLNCVSRKRRNASTWS